MIRHLRLRLRLFRRQLQAFIIHHVLHADDPPHRLALGIAIGIFVAITPTVGFQMALAVFLAWLLGANKVVGVPIVWITNPATMIPIYYYCYVVGRFILRHEPVRARWWRELARPPEGWWEGVVFYWQRFTHIAVPLWVGCLLVATILGYLSYRISLSIICTYRMRRWGSLIPPSIAAKTHSQDIHHQSDG
jgi:hypothetical protein